MLRFSRWETPVGTSLSALIGDIDRCGIYVLEFSDGELYVGQTVSLLSRFAHHRRHWPDEIRALRFAPVNPESLDRAERDVVARLAATGSRLRNVDLVALPLRSEALDVVVDPDIVASWLEETGALSIGDRAVHAKQRRRTEPAYQILAAHEDFDGIVSGAAAYVQRCLPWPHRTEGRFWTITSMPTTGRTSSWRRLCALSVNNVEVLMFGEERGVKDWHHYGFLNVALNEAIPRRLRPRRVEIGEYRTVGRVHRLPFRSAVDATSLLEDPVVGQAARQLAIGLLRKGNGLFGRFHDYNLADSVFLRLDEHGGHGPGAHGD